MSGVLDLPYWMADHSPLWVKVVVTLVLALLALAWLSTGHLGFLFAFGLGGIAMFIEGAIRRKRSNG